MPTIGETPKNILNIEQSVKDSISRLKPYFEAIGKKNKILARTDLLEKFKDKFVYIISGDFKLVLEEKIIRLYGASDFLYVSAELQKHAKIFSEYSTQVLIIDKSMFTSILQGEPEALVLYEEVVNRYSLLDLFLISHFQSAVKRPDLGMKTFEKGEIIIRNGEVSDEIYEMVDGEADVLIDGQKVGQIAESEIFGEISFFIGEKRTADVVATKNCSVNFICRDDFMELIKQRPQLIYNIAQNLAQRLSDSNRKI